MRKEGAKLQKETELGAVSRLILEFLAGTKHVAHDAHQLLRLLQQVQINERQLDALVPLLHFFQLGFVQVRELVFQCLTPREHIVRVGVIARVDDGLCLLQQREQRITHGQELFGRLSGEGIEIVVHMFLARLADAFQAIHHLLAAVALQMEPSVFLDGKVSIDTAHAKRLFASYLFQDVFLVIHCRHGFAQALQILLDETVSHLEISAVGLVKHLHQILPHMLAEQLPHLSLVA